MTVANFAWLPDRGVVSVAGPDAGKLLGGLITNDIELLAREPAIYAGLLSPQGKILFDFFVVRTGEGFLLEVARGKAQELLKRLSMYKLRADVKLEDVSENFAVAALWGGEPISHGDTAKTYSFADPRLSGLGLRLIIDVNFAADASAATNGVEGSLEAYHAHRIALGVPEGGKDYEFGDAFPHEALFDQLHGVSFTKGCYVGQEIVSRMQHRGTARKRVVQVVAAAELPRDRPEVLAGEAAIGRLGSIAGNIGLALLRLDRVAEALGKGEAVTVGGTAVRVEVPDFATFKLETVT